MVAAPDEERSSVRPYADTALDWFDAGWIPLPLPVEQKWPPPKGYTGYDEAEPNRAKIKSWIRDLGDGNVAIRMPKNVIGIDVDAYGDKHGDVTLAQLEELYGPLPPTLRTSARGKDNPSGIRWFRVREGATFPGVLGEGIEVIQWHHRYAVAPPSINPKTGTAYEAWFEDAPDEPIDTFSPDDVTELPEQWYDAQAVRGKGLDKSAELELAEVAQWFDLEPNAGTYCRAMRNVYTRELAKIEAAADGGESRYDTARDAVMAQVRLAQEGHRGVRRAINGLKRAYLEAVADEPDRDAPGEWRRMVKGAVEAVSEHMEEPHETGRCPDRAPSGGDVDPALWPAPSQPRRVAERLVDEFWTIEAGTDAPERVRTLTHWRGDFYEWSGAHWQLVEEDGLRARVWNHLDGVEYGSAKDPEVSLEWSPNKSKVANVIEGLEAVCYRPRDNDVDTGDDQFALIPFVNGMLRLERATGNRELVAHTPKQFNVYSLPFSYDEDAPAPSQWLAFLDSLDLDDDVVELLQEWFGFVLSGDMSKSKMMYLYGATRAGKGVITRVLQQLVGRANTVSPNLSQFGETFGLQPTIGKTLITINDARFRGVKTAELVERLLNFTGADDMTINRKNRDPWQGRPSARVMIISNDLPNVTGEQSTAFAKRILGPVYLHKSFYDHEDEDLERRLRRELPQIAMWAFDGYDRLCEAERFTTPVSSRKLHREVEESMSPVLAFVRERCEPAHDGVVSKDRLYRAFTKWAEEAGLYVPSKIEFGRQLRGAVGERLGESKMQAGKGNFAREHCWRGLVLSESEVDL